MSNKNTRSKMAVDASPKPQAKVAALQKVFFISQELLDNTTSLLKLEYFYHPGKGKPTLFMTRAEADIMEVIEFCEPRRSWLINNDVCSNGRVYLTTPIDVTFLVLHHLRKHCSQKALSLDSIGDTEDVSTLRLLRQFVKNEEQLKCVSDVKTAGAMVFYKYNNAKALAWLSVKARRIAAKLKSIGVNCGHSSVSQNYVRGELADDVGEETKMDYLRMACDIVGDYVDLDLYEELQKYLKIPAETILSSTQKDEEDGKSNKKRKSLQQLNTIDNKKVKIEATKEASASNSYNSDKDDVKSKSDETNAPNPVHMVEVVMQRSPTKERSLTAKEKALAKSAKGTKSIASFFKK